MKKITIVGIILGILIVLIGVNFGNEPKQIYSYTAQKNHDYHVQLKPNKFYETETLPSGGYYTSNAIDDYKMGLSYEFTADRKADIESKYKITATLIGAIQDDYNESKEVWKKNCVLKEETQNKHENVDKISICEQITINFDDYKNQVECYEKEYSVSIKAILKVKLSVTNKICVEGLNEENGKIEDCIELDIPINSTVSEVQENYEKTTQNSITAEAKNTQTIKITLYSVGGAFIVLSIISTIIAVNRKTPEEKYETTMKRIKKYYKNLIITVCKKPNIECLNTIELTTFEDLIDVAEQTKNNIILYETEETTQFYVIVDKYVYIYEICL